MAMTIRQKMMKLFYPAAKKIAQVTGGFASTSEGSTAAPSSFWELGFEDLKGNKLQMSAYKGKNVLVVNTASSCGFTGQYKELQVLQDKYSDNLVVIGFPSNDFKNQEQLSNEEISDFCEINYGVKFPLAAKSVVTKIVDQNEVFQWLTDANKNGWNDKAPSWNFTKYLVDTEGNLKNGDEAAVSPSSIELSDICFFSLNTKARRKIINF